jgi:hypothetical protein
MTMGSRFDPFSSPFAHASEIGATDTSDDAELSGDSTPEESSVDQANARASANDNGMAIDITPPPLGEPPLLAHGMATAAASEASHGDGAEGDELPIHESEAAAAQEQNEAPAHDVEPHLAPEPHQGGADDFGRLQEENTQLRQYAEQIQQENEHLMGQWEQGQKESNQVKQYLDQARRRLEQMEKAAEVAQNRERNLETLVEEKSECIAQLETRIAELEKSGAGRSGHGVLSEEELLEIQRQLEEERLQIQQERQDMEEEFKKVELTMSRERAEVARQRKEIETKKRDVEMLIETALRDERLKHQMGAILNLQSEMKGKSSGGSAIRPALGRGPASSTSNTPPSTMESYPAPQSPPGGTQYSGQGFVPPPPSTVQQQLPVDPTQLSSQQGQNQTPKNPKSSGSILRRLFKGGQQQ